MSSQLCGLGTDIVAIPRFQKILERTPEFLLRHFTRHEIQGAERRPNKIITLAGLFAGKESLLKAFGVGLFEKCELSEIEVLHLKNGMPYFSKVAVSLEEMIPGRKHYLISISHTEDNAIAIATIVKDL